jgi:Leucine-rich repeat (LRR) protein
MECLVKKMLLLLLLLSSFSVSFGMDDGKESIESKILNLPVAEGEKPRLIDLNNYEDPIGLVTFSEIIDELGRVDQHEFYFAEVLTEGEYYTYYNTTDLPEESGMASGKEMLELLGRTQKDEWIDPSRRKIKQINIYVYHIQNETIALAETFNKPWLDDQDQPAVSEQQVLDQLGALLSRIGAPLDRYNSEEQRLDLSWLDLSYNLDNEFFIELARLLPDLRVLDLSRNQLESLPREIGRLSNLKELIVMSNQLRSLPRGIRYLSNLQKLCLNVNRLRSLPPEIGQLRNLQRLNLELNRLTSLPPEIGLLRNLRVLEVNGNRLHLLPHAIGMLTRLEWFSLSFNRLRLLPREIRYLRNLNRLDVSGNDQLAQSVHEIQAMLNGSQDIAIRK